MTTIQQVELGVLGPLQVRQFGLPVAIPGAKPRAILTMLGLHGGSVVAADMLVELLWGEDPPRTADRALQTHVSALRRALGDGSVLTEGAGWKLGAAEVDANRYQAAARAGREAVATGDASRAGALFDEALQLWRGGPELPDGRRGDAERTRWVEDHAALVEDRADALLATGRAAELIGELEAAIADAPLRERRWGQLMLALYRAGRQGEALGAYQRARTLLVDELGVDPGPDLRRLEAAIVAQDMSLDSPAAQHVSSVMRAVTFLLTDIEGSTAAWEADAEAMAVALARHDELVERAVTSRGGRLIKTRGEGDATFSVFDRPSGAAASAIELQDAIAHEPWPLTEPMRIRIAVHTGEAELRDGDYFGRAVNRAARLRSLAMGGQIVCSGATAELVVDSLADDVVLADLGMRQLKNLARPEHVFELRLDSGVDTAQQPTGDVPIERPELPAPLTGPGPFVGRGPELERLTALWEMSSGGGAAAVLIAGEPGVGKTRLAGEWSCRAYKHGAIVLYGRCDEELGAPYQPFAEAMRALVRCLRTTRLRGLRGVEALLPLVPRLTDVLPDLIAPPRADPDTERYALFDAVVALLELTSTSAPVVLILDDLHWATKPTLLLMRHLLRFGEHARVQIVGTYRSTDLDRSHPLAAMLADLHRDGTEHRLQLSGLDEDDVSAYVAEAGYDDEELARALATVTGGNPFFLIEALRHVEESGGRWDRRSLPQGVREAVSRRLSRLPEETNSALAAAAVVGSRFALDLVEQVVEQDLVDAFDQAAKAGIVIEEPGGRYRFNHALVRQSLLAELTSVRRMRLHQRIATTLAAMPGADDELVAELAYHYFECAWAGNAAKAIEYCKRAADQAMARLGYEGAAELYDHAVHALDELDDELSDRDDQRAELLIARCEALLAAGDVASAVGAVAHLQKATQASPRLAAWATCFDGQLSMLIHPERLDEVESALSVAADRLGGLDDAAGEAKAHTVRAGCLARLGRIGDCETALDQALTAARRAREHRRVNAVLAGAPLAALWGPNPVPRAGGRCLDVVRLLRITTDSPAVEATSTRCQAVLEAYRGRSAASRRMIDSARRTVAELGLRHATLEVEHFAGIVELVADDPAAAEPLLRKAHNGFRRMGLDADTAETAALLGGVCLALGRDVEADELCSESERLAGHGSRASIAWRTLRAQLLARSGEHDAARQMAEAAVGIAERTDALVDHGDACLALATVLDSAGDSKGAQAAAGRAIELYERKGAAALAEKARQILGERAVQPASAAPEPASVELDNACVQAIARLDDAVDRVAWSEVEELLASVIAVESRRKIVGFARIDLSFDEWTREIRRYREMDVVRHHRTVVAVRGNRLALTRQELGTTDASPGAPQDEMLQLFSLDHDGRIAMCVLFDAVDIDAAITELDAQHTGFEELDRRVPFENTASHVCGRFLACFGARDWAALSELLADDVLDDDRRRVVNSGVRRGRDAAMASRRAMAEVGVSATSLIVVATRGERLALIRQRLAVRDEMSDSPYTAELLGVVEIDAQQRILARIAFDLDDIDAAFAELDARYLAGEAAPYADTWSVIAGGLAAVNRREFPAVTPDWVNIDHRRGTAFAPGELTAYIGATWEDLSDFTNYIEAVHRLTDVGMVVTQAVHGVSQQGVVAEWRMVSLTTVEGDLLKRCELFDEADLDAALATFDDLSRPAQRLENTASQVYERFGADFAARDWDAMAQMLADDTVSDDRRRPVNSGTRNGRDSVIASMRAITDVGVTDASRTVVATRGSYLALIYFRLSGGDQAPEAFYIEMLGLVEIDADERIVAHVTFDLDDIDAAFAELDARYLAGEAAAHAQTWSVIAAGYAALNRREPGPTTPDWVNIDHRRATAFAPGDLIEYLRAGFEVTPDLTFFVESVHRLSSLGAVVTNVGHGTSEGFDAEWRETMLFTVEGELVNRVELFEEADLDAALTRLDELSQPTPRAENAASRTYEQWLASFASRDWDAIASMLDDDVSQDDRRRVVNAGLLRGRDHSVANLQAIADVGTVRITLTPLAVRGNHLCLSVMRLHGAEMPGAFVGETLALREINADHRVTAGVAFDIEDVDAAFAELDARYLAGEAAEHANTWSVIAAAYASLNRRELPPTTPDWVNIDHRKGTPFAPGDITASIRAAWDQTPGIRFYVESVHRLSELGVVVTHVEHGTSREGFDAEWRSINLLTVEGGRISRCEVFEESDLDAALARFDELSHPGLENAASQVIERFYAHFAARDWNAMAALLVDDFADGDRRRVVGHGLRRGRDAELENLRAIAAVGVTNVRSTVVATRGDRLMLGSLRFTGRDPRPDAFASEVLCLHEIDEHSRIVGGTAFDPNDLDAAFTELDARYLAGEAAAYAHTWSVIAEAYAALNRREVPATTPDFVDIDHRRVIAGSPGELTKRIRSGLELAREFYVRIETVHRLSELGAVVTRTANAMSQEGFHAEWRFVVLLAVEGDLISRCEIFDEEDLDAALARFDELSLPAPRLENEASRTLERLQAAFVSRDWNAMTEIVADDVLPDDRRPVVGAGVRRGRDGVVTDLQVVADLGVKEMASTVIATRGDRLLIERVRFAGDRRPDAFHVAVLNVVQVDAEGRVAATVTFNPDDIDAAFAELDARYLAGEAADHAQTWSVVAGAFVAFNRRELPSSTPDLVNVDHRRGLSYEAGDAFQYFRVAWDVTPDIRSYIEKVHQLSRLGAVVTNVACGTSADGFAAEWRAIEVLTVEGDRVSRFEAFDEEDLDAALARFDELNQPAPQGQ